MTLPTKPTAEGTLDKTPLAHLLVYALDQRLTGFIVFENPSGPPHVVYFLDGRPAKIRLGKAVEPLDRVLLDLGHLDPSTLQASLLAISKSGELHGRYLIGLGLLDEPTLLAALRAQLARKLGHLFSLSPETHYAYFEGANLAATYGGPELTPYEGLSIVMAGIRTQASEPVVEATLSRLGDRTLTLHKAVDLRLFGLQREESSVVDLLRSARLSFDQLLASKVAHETIVRRTVYALAITRHLDTGSGKPPVGVHVQPQSVPPMEGDIQQTPTPAPSSSASPRRSITPTPIPQRSASPVPQQSVSPVPASQPSAALLERRAEIRQKLDGIETMTYYARLDLPATAENGQIEAAYFALAKRFHPDRLSNDLAELKSEAARLFGHLTEAYQVLVDPERRRQYDESLESGVGAHEDAAQIARVVDAALEFQKAEALLKKNDLAGAEQLASRAVTADPGQPEYVTLLAWIQAQRREDPPGLSDGQTSPHFDDLIKLLDGVLAKEERYERALFYRGMLLKRAGYADRAIQDFRLAAQINPRNIDAAREVRLFDMRQQNAKQPPTTPSSRGGLFSKLFKKG